MTSGTVTRDEYPHGRYAHGRVCPFSVSARRNEFKSGSEAFDKKRAARERDSLFEQPPFKTEANPTGPGS
jgi:hypothetical protein